MYGDEGGGEDHSNDNNQLYAWGDEIQRKDKRGISQPSESALTISDIAFCGENEC
jgi:hypothetical protein